MESRKANKKVRCNCSAKWLLEARRWEVFLPDLEASSSSGGLEDGGKIGYSIDICILYLIYCFMSYNNIRFFCSHHCDASRIHRSRSCV